MNRSSKPWLKVQRRRICGECGKKYNEWRMSREISFNTGRPRWYCFPSCWTLERDAMLIVPPDPESDSRKLPGDGGQDWSG